MEESQKIPQDVKDLAIFKQWRNKDTVDTDIAMVTEKLLSFRKNKSKNLFIMVEINPDEYLPETMYLMKIPFSKDESGEFLIRQYQPEVYETTMSQKGSVLKKEGQ